MNNLRPLPFSFFVFCFLTSLTSYSQIDFLAEVSLQSQAATDGVLPFWMYHNQRGRLSENTNFPSWISGRGIYQLTENASLEAGTGLLYQEEVDKLQLDELYLGFRNTWMEAVVGRKQKEELYNGLSSSNENILWSLNARPLPGIQLSTIRPIFFWPKAGLGFEASL